MLNQEKIFGGISTAIKVFKDLYSPIDKKTFDVRVIVINEATSYPSLCEAVRKYFNDFVYMNAYDMDEGDQIIDLEGYSQQLIPIRKNDIFFATAWWTATIADQLQKSTKEMFGVLNKFIYLIQDYEPGFYNWSEAKVNAEATYLSSERFVAIINSEELYINMQNRYHLKNAYCLPFCINNTIKENIDLGLEKKNQILVYARPSTPRNLFGIIIESLKVFQQNYTDIANNYDIVFAGEKFSNNLCKSLYNYKIAGKMTLEEYAYNLSISKIGLSLMMSPHPSYPPLEMAYAGCNVITNTYENKDLSLRSRHISSVKEITPDNIAIELYKACTISEDKSKEIKEEWDKNTILNMPKKTYLDKDTFLEEYYYGFRAEQKYTEYQSNDAKMR